jgi:carbon monoxide dehydrogenase subunit G
MHLEGTHTFTADLETVWAALNDPEVLARATPGVTSMEPLGEDKYQTIFDIKMGPIKSTFNGTLEVTDKVAPERFKLLVSVQGKIGAVAAEGSFDLQSQDGATVVAFSGDARMTGVLARMGQRVISGVARMFTKQFFSTLELELAQG